MRWGIMGTGRMARVFCETLAQMSGEEIYAVGSRNSESGEAFAKKHRAKVWYGSYEEFVKDSQIDAVYVSTPIGCHYETAKLCLEAGRNVLCEKALVLKKEEAEELFAIAKRNQVFFMEALWTKCHPVFRKVEEWKEQGVFGDILAVEAKFYTGGTKEHRLYKHPIHGGSLYDLTLYPLVYAGMLLGYEPKEIEAHMVGSEYGTDAMEHVQLIYEGGRYASLSSGISMRRQASLYVHGTKGRLLIDDETFLMAQKAEVYDWNNEIIASFECPFEINGMEYEIYETSSCISHGKKESSLNPAAETIARTALLENIKEILDNHRCV